MPFPHCSVLSLWPLSYYSDDIRRYLPEYSTYLKQVPDQVNRLTRQEAGYISETLTWATLQAGRNVVLHCNLRSVEWYQQHYLPKLRHAFAGLQVALLHVTADRGVVLARARQRATGHCIDEAQVVQESEHDIPLAVVTLKPAVDFSCTLCNNHDVPLEIIDCDWETFRKAFDQSWLRTPASSSKTPPPIPKPHTGHRRARTQGDQISPTTRQDDLAPVSPGADGRREALRSKRFSALQSSEDNHASPDFQFFGQFAHIRSTLDYTYHKNYTFTRQRFQDAIVREFLDAALVKDPQTGHVCSTPTRPWIVFTAGAMGAGKGYTVSKLVQNGRFPLLAFVRVNPDAIRRHLPEYHLYIRQSPQLAGDLTNKEAGYIAEILMLASLKAGKNVICDGSLRHTVWYRALFARLRREFEDLRIAILHVTAPRQVVFQRAAVRHVHMMEKGVEPLFW